jgi:hypothetical protein
MLLSLVGRGRGDPMERSTETVIFLQEKQQTMVISPGKMLTKTYGDFT